MFETKLDTLANNGFDYATCKRDPAQFVDLRNELGAGANPAILDPTILRDGVSENTLSC
eukprot:SAG22_NODE_6222_length_884_cov_0.797452_2_plen_59_part_00